MLKIERKPVWVDENTWFYVSRKSIHMIHWQEVGGTRRCASFRVPTKTLRRSLVMLSMQAAKERAARSRKRPSRKEKP